MFILHVLVGMFALSMIVLVCLLLTILIIEVYEKINSLRYFKDIYLKINNNEYHIKKQVLSGFTTMVTCSSTIFIFWLVGSLILQKPIT